MLVPLYLWPLIFYKFHYVGGKKGEPLPSPPLGYDHEQQAQFKLKETM